MSTLNTQPNIADPDGFYADLVKIHVGRNKKASDAINAHLILLLCNHIGDQEVLNEAMEAASRAVK